MKKRLFRKGSSLVCLLLVSLYAELALADWSFPPSQGYGRQGYGDFPPKDIDKFIREENLKTEKRSGLSQSSKDTASAADNGNQPAQNSAQALSAQNVQMPNYGVYNQGIPLWNNRAGYRPRNNRGSGFSGPWNNNGSSFSGPWNNSGSSFGPWGNRGGWW